MTFRVRITEQGLVIPRDVIDRLGSEVIEIIEEPGRLLITPVMEADGLSRERGMGTDPIQDLGENPVNTGVKDGSTNHDGYLYTGG